MKFSISKERLRFYLWVSLAFTVMWVLMYSHKYDYALGKLIVNTVWRLPLILLLNIILFEFSIHYIRRNWKKVILPLLLIFLHLMLYSWGMYAWRLLGENLNIYTNLSDITATRTVVSGQMGMSMFSVFFYGTLLFIYNYVKLKQAAQKLRIEKQAAELNYLKSQTNPHFLFNTLNNIYSLSRDKSDRAPESILRLSKILRFMLYETSGEFISIEQEIKIISDYIELEKLRYDDSLRVNFNHDIENLSQSVPPLLMIPLVENAFKHGVSESRGNPYVDIHLSVSNRQLKFVVKNSTEEPSETFVKENIGLSNLRRQLELLYKDYALEVQHTTSVFIATLKINLASHV